jgi:hypothetical protein
VSYGAKDETRILGSLQVTILPENHTFKQFVNGVTFYWKYLLAGAECRVLGVLKFFNMSGGMFFIY